MDTPTNPEQEPHPSTYTPSTAYLEAIVNELQNPTYQNMDPQKATYLANVAVLKQHQEQTETTPSPFNPDNNVDNLIIALSSLQD